jgi:hypothetical protein
MRIGSAPPVLGKAAVLRGLEPFLERTEPFGRVICEAWRARDALLLETELRWLGASAAPPIVPCFLIIRSRAGLIEDMRWYCERPSA